ncbi:MAG: hypothetical protein K2W95_02360 [Candidatus Obscuribacterales bacterium]|nr:hypothetical protein [Candidatus Obscuribacterales bacterium]
MSETPDSTTPELEKPPGGQPDVERADIYGESESGNPVRPTEASVTRGKGLPGVELYQPTPVADTRPVTPGVQPAKEVQPTTTSVASPVSAENGVATAPLKETQKIGTSGSFGDLIKEQPAAPVPVVKAAATEAISEVRPQTSTTTEPRYGAAKTEFQAISDKNNTFSGDVERTGINLSTASSGGELIKGSVAKDGAPLKEVGFGSTKEPFVQAKETPTIFKEQAKVFESFEKETPVRSVEFGGKTNLPNMKDTYSVAQGGQNVMSEVRDAKPVNGYVGYDAKYTDTGKFSDSKTKIAETLTAEESHPREATRASVYDGGYKPKPEYSFATGETPVKPYYPNSGGSFERLANERNSVDHGLEPSKLGKLQEAAYSSGVNTRATEFTSASYNPKLDKELYSGMSAAGYAAPSYYDKEKFRTDYGATAAGAVPNKLDYVASSSGTVPSKLDYAGRSDYTPASYPGGDRRLFSEDRTAYDAKYDKLGANAFANAQPVEGRLSQANLDGKILNSELRSQEPGRAFETTRSGDIAGRSAPAAGTESGTRAVDSVRPTDPAATAPRFDALASRGDHPGAIPTAPAPIEHAPTLRLSNGPVDPVRLAEATTPRPAEVPTAISRSAETPSGVQPGRPTAERYVEYVAPSPTTSRAEVPVTPVVAPSAAVSATSFARTSIDTANAVPVDATRGLSLDGRAVPLDGRLPADGRVAGDLRSVALPVIDPRTGLLVEGRVLDGRGVVVPLDGRAVSGGDTRAGAVLPVDGRTVALSADGRAVVTTGADGRGMTVLPDGRIVPSSVDGRVNVDGRGIQTGAILDGRQIGLPGAADARTGRIDAQPAGRVELPGAVVRAEQPSGTRGVDADGRGPSDRAPAGNVRVDADGVVRIVPTLAGTTEAGVRSVRDPLTGEFLDDGGEEIVEDDDGTIVIRKVKGEKRYITGVELAIAGLLTAAAAARHRSDGEEILNGNIDPDSVLPDVQVADGDELDPNSQEVQANAIMARRSYLIAPGDTFQSIAEQFYRDSSLGWLIADLNSGAIKESKLDGKRVLEVACRQVIELPDFRDIQAFRVNKPRNVDFDAIVTIVTENSVDKELLQSYLGRVTGASNTKPTAAAVATEGDAVIVESDELKIKAKLTKPRHLAALLKGLPDTVAAMTRNRRSSSDSSQS